MTTPLTIFLEAGPGEKLQQTLGGEIGSLFLLAVIVLSLKFFWERAFSKFIGFALFSMLVAVFIFKPELISNMGEKAFNWLITPWVNNLPSQ
jgi:hypothetical protein